MGLDWSEHYLLGWYDRSGRAYLTTWDGDLPVVHVVVTGCAESRIPLWSAKVPPGARLEPVPEGQDPHEYAAELGGYHAIGWRVPVPGRIVREVLES